MPFTLDDAEAMSLKLPTLQSDLRNLERRLNAALAAGHEDPKLIHEVLFDVNRRVKTLNALAHYRPR